MYQTHLIDRDWKSIPCFSEDVLGWSLSMRYNSCQSCFLFFGFWQIAILNPQGSFFWAVHPQP